MDLEPNLAVALPSDDYVFTFRAYDTFETVSSPLSVQVAMENHAPFLAESTLPDTVNLPTGADTTIFPITIRCWDDQTAEDIAWVKLQAQKPDDTWGSEIELFDDGNLALSGDELAGDSVFTRIVSILPTNLLGLYRFHLRAEDRAGNEIEVVDSLLVVP